MLIRLKLKTFRLTTREAIKTRLKIAAREGRKLMIFDVTLQP